MGWLVWLCLSVPASLLVLYLTESVARDYLGPEVRHFYPSGGLFTRETAALYAPTGALLRRGSGDLPTSRPGWG